MKGCFGQAAFSFSINNACIYFTVSEKCEHECVITAPCGPPLRVTEEQKKQPHRPCQGPSVPYWRLLRLPPCCHSTSPAELHFPALFNIRMDPMSSVCYFKSHESFLVSYQTLNHVLGCRPSPPIFLILPVPRCLYFGRWMKLKEA